MVERLLLRRWKIGERTYHGAAADDLTKFGAGVRLALAGELGGAVGDDRIERLESGKITNLARRGAEYLLFGERQRGSFDWVVVLPSSAQCLVFGNRLRHSSAKDAIAHPIDLRGAGRRRQTVRPVAVEVPVRALETEVRGHVGERGKSRNGTFVREIVLVAAANGERDTRLPHRKKRSMVEAVRQLVPEELLRVVAAALADDLVFGRNVAVRRRHLDPLVERLYERAHRAAARRTQHSKP